MVPEASSMQYPGKIQHRDSRLLQRSMQYAISEGRSFLILVKVENMKLFPANITNRNVKQTTSRNNPMKINLINTCMCVFTMRHRFVRM